MTDRPIVFLDTETNGLHADRRPWEIAWIRRDVDGTETEQCFQIADVDNTNAELKGLQVGRFHERFKGGPKASWSLTIDTTLIPRDQRTLLLEVDAAIEVEKATRGAIIVGAVPNFDTEVLAAMLRRHKLCPSWHYQLVDIEALAAGWQLRFEQGNMKSIREMDPNVKFGPSQNVPPWRSDDLSRACGVEPPTEEERHTALGDARWVQRWYDHIMGGAA